MTIYLSTILPTPYDTVPGADDNASGVCAVLESARLLSQVLILHYSLNLLYLTKKK